MDFSRDLVNVFESYLNTHQPPLSEVAPEAQNRLVESMQYSLKTGGKRFRPVLSLLTAKTLGCDPEKALPVALAVEYIHTYSLIHDDLPMMDDDDERRGQPTNHKVYGEPVALLAGDGLLTESFAHLGRVCSRDKAGRIIALVAEAAGWQGMVGGQVVDIEPSEKVKMDWIDFIHENKTGALIRVSVEAAAVACEASESQVQSLREFAKNLGFAFQLADDLLDWDPENPENTSYVAVYGEDSTREKLNTVSERCLQILNEAGLPAEWFEPLIQFNSERNK